MANKKNNDKPVDVFIEHELSKIKDESTGKKPIVKSILKIPFTPDKRAKAFRVFGNEGFEIVYASTRIDTLEETAAGYEVDVTSKQDLLGKGCILTDVETKEIVLRGVITEKKAESQVFEMPKAEEKNKKAANS